MIDLAALARLAAADALIRGERAYGAPGTEALRQVLETVHAAYAWVAPEILSGGLTIFRTLDANARPIDSSTAVTLDRLDGLPALAQGALTLQWIGDGRLLVWTARVDPSGLPAEAAAYELRPGDGEHLWIGGASDRVPVVTPYASQFAVPTFWDLEDALSHYAIHFARNSTCHILAGIWRDPARLLMHSKPEETMRRSLENYLRSTLRSHKLIEVRPEQVVDESKEIDIKVTWAVPNRIALIEIKWLGESLGPSGQSTSYSEGRARVDGVQQLVDYLDRNRPRSPIQVVVGYLVVFDGRRRGLTPGQTQITFADALHYSTAEITYDPAILSRQDFGPPYRLFMEAIPTS